MYLRTWSVDPMLFVERLMVINVQVKGMISKGVFFFKVNLLLTKRRLIQQ